MKCPICSEYELVEQSLEDNYYPDLFCPKIITLPNRKIYAHYRELYNRSMQRTIVLPYKLSTIDDKSKIAILSQYKTGDKNWYFKTMITVDFKIPAHFIQDNVDEDKLRERIKMLMVFK